MKKYTKIIIAFMLIATVLTACSVKNEAKTTNASFFDTLEPVELDDTMSIPPLYEYLSMSGAYFINEILAGANPKDKTYTFEDEKYDYAIMRVKNEDCFAFLLYEKEDGAILEGIYTDEFYDRKDFMKILPGTPLSVLEKTVDKVTKKLKYAEEDVYYEIYYFTDGGYIELEYNDRIIKHTERYEGSEYGFMDILKSSNDFDIEALFAD